MKNIRIISLLFTFFFKLVLARDFILLNETFEDETKTTSWSCASFTGAFSIVSNALQINIAELGPENSIYAMATIKSFEAPIDISTVNMISFDVFIPQQAKRECFHIMYRVKGQWQKINYEYKGLAVIPEKKWTTLTYIIRDAEDGEADGLRLYFNQFRDLDKIKNLEIDNLILTGSTDVTEKKETPLFERQEPIVKPTRTMVFPRTQLKYSLFQNYLHQWIDRPLLFDRSLRFPTGSWEFLTYDSFSKDIEIVKSYGLDGLANIANSGLVLYQTADDIANKYTASGFILFPEFSGGPKIDDTLIDTCEKIVRRAMTSKCSWKLGGRVVVTSYVADAWTPKQIKELLDCVRTRAGDFIFIADMRIDINTLIDAFQNETINETVALTIRDKWKSYLDVCDGLMFAGANHMAYLHNKNAYGLGHHLATDFYEEGLIPFFQSIFFEPQYANKLFGLSAAVGYVNHLNASIQFEECTKHLRNSMEIALRAKPDFILMPEWNEVNENTSIQPTVAGSFANQRIMKYYMRQLKKEVVSANPGDDRTIPNMIISYRRVVKIGERIDIELLNVPDTLQKSVYAATLALKDFSGNIVIEFPKETFSAQKMRDKTYSIGSEEYAGYRVLCPELTVVNSAGQAIPFTSGLSPILMQTTWNIDYQCVKQPLRDVCRPISSSLTVVDSTNNTGRSIRLRAFCECAEEIASAEILENDVEVYSLDRLKEFDPENNIMLRGSLMSKATRMLNGKMYIRNASSFNLRPSELANSDIRDYKIEKDCVSFAQRANANWRLFLLTIPKKDIGKAVLDFDLDTGKFSIQLKKIVENGYFGKAFNEQFYFSLERYTRLADIPVPVNSKKIDFTCAVYPENPNPVYYLRIITKTRKIYRSKPLMPMDTVGEIVAMPVFSEIKNSVTQVRVKAKDILDLNYEFSPRLNDAIPCLAGTMWVGEFGGGTRYGGPFHGSGLQGYPSSETNASPIWVIEDNFQCLKFDGLGQYINFPTEAFPRGAFTLEFTIKMTVNKNQVLFRHHGMLIGSLTLFVKNGKLSALFTDSDQVNTAFESEIEVPVAKWTKIDIMYDLKQMIFKVDDKTSAPFPFNKEAIFFAPCVFGGQTRPGFGLDSGYNYFQGYLKSFRITHNAKTVR